jgi:hypothetical protein
VLIPEHINAIHSLCAVIEINDEPSNHWIFSDCLPLAVRVERRSLWIMALSVCAAVAATGKEQS